MGHKTAMGLVRTEVRLKEEQYDRIRRMALAKTGNGISISVVLREILDQYFDALDVVEKENKAK